MTNPAILDASPSFRASYKNFRNTLYNSGAYVRNSRDGAIWHQAQFGDAKDGYLFGQTPGADGKKKSFNLSKQVTDMRVKPAGEWNTLEVTAVGKVLTDRKSTRLNSSHAK